MRIAYLHGLESVIKADDSKIILLNQISKETYTPYIEYRDPSTFDRLYLDIKRMQPDLIVGSSMGGYFAYLIGSKLNMPTLVFNPAVVDRSFDPVVNSENLKSTHHTVYLGQHDQVVNGDRVASYFKEFGVGSFSYHAYDGGHRVPYDVFKTALLIYKKT